MIFFGTRGVTYSKASGSFHCPQCGANTPYKHRRVRRFFTLYFIPMIPLDLLGEYVECQKCKGTYKEEVLKHDPAADQAAFDAEFHQAIRRVMVMMILADGSVDDAEITSLRGIYQKVAGKELAEPALRAEIAQAQKVGGSVEEYLKTVAPSLNPNGKELVIKAAFLVAISDGKVHEHEEALLERIAKALEVTPAHLRGIVAELKA